MLVIRQKMIFRGDLQANPDILYVFGDNLERKGLGGQAKEMRGEPNAYGIATKRRMAHGTDDCYFFDGQEGSREIISNEFFDLEEKLREEKYKAVVLPLDGIGTGLARLPDTAPELLRYINIKLAEIERDYYAD